VSDITTATFVASSCSIWRVSWSTDYEFSGLSAASLNNSRGGTALRISYLTKT